MQSIKRTIPRINVQEQTSIVENNNQLQILTKNHGQSIVCNDTQTKSIKRYNNVHYYTVFTNKKPTTVVILSNEGPTNDEFQLISNTPTLFGTDNCATHHICNYITLLTGGLVICHNIMVRGASGEAKVTKTGIVKFTITAEDGQLDTTSLPNVIYLPKCGKKLISISHWSEDQNDDCEIVSPQKHSIFL